MVRERTTPYTPEFHLMSVLTPVLIPTRLRLPLLCLLALTPVLALGAGTPAGRLADGSAAHAATTAQPASADGAPLEERIRELDDAVFDAFNRCADPVQLDRHAAYFADDVEFYHDTGGVTWNRRDMLANTRRYACGHYTRERMPGTLKVFPIRDFGAVEQGVHRFCRTGGTCEGEADFVIVWREMPEGWRITRVLSYGHRPAS